jgi:hypothetical protein
MHTLLLQKAESCWPASSAAFPEAADPYVFAATELLETLPPMSKEHRHRVLGLHRVHARGLLQVLNAGQ